MARFQAAAKPSVSVNSLKKKSLIARAASSVAEIATAVASETSPPFSTVVVAASPVVSASPVPVSSVLSVDPPITEEITPAFNGEEGVEIPTPKLATSVSKEVSLPVLPEVTKETKSYASLLKASAELKEIGTPSEHVTGVPFVFIPDENIAATKEEFKEFIYARFHGDWPAMGRIIGVVNALWAKNGPRIFVHNVGE